MTIVVKQLKGRLESYSHERTLHNHLILLTNSSWHMLPCCKCNLVVVISM